MNRSEIRAPDGGPFYLETPVDLTNFTGIAEPYNAITASFFVLIAIFWAVRLLGRYREYPFLTVCLPILFVGGLGGTLYHGLRNWMGWFLMDLIPIYLLGLFVTLYIWIRLGPKIRHLFAVIGVLCLLQGMGHLALPRAWAINVSYAGLAILILTPIVIAMIRTQFRHSGWIAMALVSFGIAWFCRISDYWEPPLLPMGMHWLWHTFGAITAASLSQYIYLLERMILKIQVVANREGPSAA